MEPDAIILETSSEPIYQAVARMIRDKVTSGEWKSGHKLPSEEQLVAKFGISRGTLRKAIGLLVSEGILERAQGKGTFVTMDKVSYPFAQELISFAEEMTRRGQVFHTQVLNKNVETADDVTLDRLGAAPGSRVLVLERTRDIDGTPAVYMKNWVLLDKCPGLDQEDFTKVGLFDAIERCSGKRLKYGVRNFSARILDSEQSKLVGRKPGDSILFMTQTTYGQDDEPIEYSNFLLRTDQYQVSSVLYR